MIRKPCSAGHAIRQSLDELKKSLPKLQEGEREREKGREGARKRERERDSQRERSRESTPSACAVRAPCACAVRASRSSTRGRRASEALAAGRRRMSCRRLGETEDRSSARPVSPECALWVHPPDRAPSKSQATRSRSDGFSMLRVRRPSSKCGSRRGKALSASIASKGVRAAVWFPRDCALGRPLQIQKAPNVPLP